MLKSQGSEILKQNYYRIADMFNARKLWDYLYNLVLLTSLSITCEQVIKWNIIFYNVIDVTAFGCFECRQATLSRR